MQEREIHFSCRCGRRLTAVIAGSPARLRLRDHGILLREKICPTPGCGRDYRRVSVQEFKENVFSNF